MPEDRDSVQVKVELQGAHLRVDARPARLVSQLRGGDGEPMVTAQPHGGDGLTESVPPAARQVTMRVSDELSIEATRAADFVALADEGSGRRLVVAFTGEVTVLPKGAGGDRFALSAHEALLVPAGGGEPRVVPLAELSDDEQGEITSAVEAASLAVATPSSADNATPEPEPEPTQEVAAVDDATTGDIVPGDTKRGGTQARPPVTATPTPAKAGGGAPGGGGRPGDTPRRGKKGKKGRPQPPPAKRSGAIIPAAAGAAGAGTAAAAASAAKKGAPPIKKATTAPAKKATTGGPGKGGGGGANRGGGGGGGGRGGSDTPGGDRRFVLGAIGLAALVAIVLAVFVLTGNNGDKTAVDTTTTTTTAAPAATTTAAPAATTTAAPAAATTTVKPAAATTTVKPAAATTTTAKPVAATTTAKPAVAANYAIEPKTCVQNGNSITYTATLTNKASAAFDFTVRVVFKDSSGAAVASSDAAVNKVAPNKSVDFTATGTTSRNLANSGANCTVERVDAHPSGT
jgi:hypothetical protein